MQSIQLPAPAALNMPLGEVIQKRRSGRVFSEKPLSKEHLSSLLFATVGITDPSGHRAVPSARDCREIVAYVCDKDGVWSYDEKTNILTQVREGDVRGETTQMQDFVAKAPVTLIFAVDAKRCGNLIGSRAERCIHLDAGCMMLATQLAATSLGLVSVPRASFDVTKVQELLSSGPDFTPIITVTVGYPA